MALVDVHSEVTGKVWKLLIEIGAPVTPDDAIMVVESMKMEIPVSPESAGTLVAVLVAEGDSVEDGQVVARIEKT
ncbi:MAG: biotin/lipoyl-binding protein [Variovorax sp.]|nr:MAG: biotin/lipoyl-binding protein [Variovorax sp.]